MTTMNEPFKTYLDAYEDAIDEVLEIVYKHVNEDTFLTIQAEVKGTLLN